MFRGISRGIFQGEMSAGFGGIFHEGMFGRCPGELSWVGVRTTVQDYKCDYMSRL